MSDGVGRTGPANLVFFQMSLENDNGRGPGSSSIVTLNISDATVIAMVGSRLRAMYDDLLNEPVPERLLEVVHRFDRTDDTSTPRRGDLRNGT